MTVKCCIVMVEVEVEDGDHASERAVLSVHRVLIGQDRPYRMKVVGQQRLVRAYRRERRTRDAARRRS